MIHTFSSANDPDQARMQQAQFQLYDLLLKGGRVIDPSSGLDALRDVAFRGARVAAIHPSIDADHAAQTLDVSGKIVSPGWIDYHTHVYTGVSPLSIDADSFCLPRGVTTAVSAGDAGAATFEGFVRYVVKPSRTRLFGFINICRTGLSGYPIGELRDLALLDVVGTARAAIEFADVCLGIKVRMTQFIVGENGLEPLHRAIRAAEIAQTRVMVHIYDIPGTLPDLLHVLREGDIVTHVYMGTQNGILDANHRVIPSVQDAQQRGVLFDVGHGSKAGFSLPVARHAIHQGLLPHTISTDLHTQSAGGSMGDLAHVMTKFLALGLSLHDVLARVTVNPANLIGRVPTLGTLRESGIADAVVFTLDDHPHEITDDTGNRLPSKSAIRVHHTIRDGRIVGTPYRHPHI
jgi:dihydroorotase